MKLISCVQDDYFPFKKPIYILIIAWSTPLLSRVPVTGKCIVLIGLAQENQFQLLLG